MSEVLPQGWSEVLASDLFSFITSGSRGWAAHYAADGAAFIRVQNVQRGDVSLNLGDVQRVRPPAGAEGSRTRLRAGDLAITITADLGRVGLVADNIGEAYVNQHVALARPMEACLAPYLAWFFSGPEAQEQLGLLDRGATRSGLGLKDIGAVRVPIPPLAEQRRIAAQVEALLARTRRIRAELGQMATRVRRFREAAVERAYEPEPGAGWTTATAADLAEIKSGIALGKRYPPDVRMVERPYLRVANVQRGHLQLAEVKTVQVSEAEAERLTLHPGDVLMNEGGDRDKLGRGWVWNGEVPGCIHQNHVFRLRLKTDAVTPVFLSRYANHFGQRYFLDEGKQTTNLASISMSRVAALPVPVPPRGKAAKIDAQLEAVEAKADVLTTEIARALALLDRLDAAILTRAFRGELVPQDPADEPAAALLARLATAPKATTPRRNRTRAA